MKPQCSSNQQFPVAKLPVQWMPFPQYPLRSRMKILLQELQELPDNLNIQKNYQRSSTPKAWTTEVIFFEQTFIHVQTSLFQKGRCCDMGQNDTIGKIELNPSIVLSSDNTNCKNDIQLFHQLFDELSVYRDYH